MMKKTFQLLNVIFLVVTILMNYLSNTGIFNGETMASISAKYPSLFTPAGYAFSIWGLIYLGLFGFVLYYGAFSKNSETKEKTVQKIGWWFVISCICNSLWVVTWIYGYLLLSVPIMIFLLVSLFKIIGNTKEEFRSNDVKTNLFLKLPFSIYAGWISVALIANIAAFLVKIEWNGFGIYETTWTIIMISIAGLLHLFMIWKQKMVAFACLAVWALVAIAVANHDRNDTVYNVALAIAAILLVSILIYIIKDILKKRNSSVPA